MIPYDEENGCTEKASSAVTIMAWTVMGASVLAVWGVLIVLFMEACRA